MKKIQTVYITLSDGSVGAFTGPVLVTEKEIKKGMQYINSVGFSVPKELPEEYVLEMLDTKN